MCATGRSRAGRAFRNGSSLRRSRRPGCGMFIYRRSERRRKAVSPTVAANGTGFGGLSRKSSPVLKPSWRCDRRLISREPRQAACYAPNPIGGSVTAAGSTSASVRATASRFTTLRSAPRCPNSLRGAPHEGGSGDQNRNIRQSTYVSWTMPSSTPSVRSIDIPARHVESVYLVAHGNTLVRGADEVSTSWKRSASKHGVNPDSNAAPRSLTSHELNEIREPLDRLILSAQEEIDKLYKVVRDAGYTLLFCDTAGVAVEHRGEEGDASLFKYWGTWLGGVWSEAIERTNGIGTCIAEERPITVHRGQHYRSRHIDLSCSGAPTFGADGRLIAVLDVSAIDPERSERAHALTGALTVASARAIEERFFREQFRREWIVAAAPPEEGAACMLLAADGNQRVVGANRTARTSLLLDDRALRDGVSLWSCFEQDRALFRRKDTTDIPALLVVAGSDETRAALV